VYTNDVWLIDCTLYYVPHKYIYFIHIETSQLPVKSHTKGNNNKKLKIFFLFSVTNRTWHIAIIWSKIVSCLSSSSAELLTIFIFCSSAIGPMSNKVGIKHSWVKYKYIQMYRIVWLIDYILIYVTLEHFHLDWDASIAGEGPHKRK